MARDSLKLKSGREIYANHGIIGLAPDDDEYFDLTEGYDSQISTGDWDDNGKYTQWPKEDIVEICDIMIERWTKFKEKVQNGLRPSD
jgi:hypothetical protein